MNDGRDSGLDTIEKSILKHQILDRIGRQSEFGKYQKRRALFDCPLREGKDSLDVLRGRGDLDARCARSDAEESVRVKRLEGWGAAHGVSCWAGIGVPNKRLRAVKSAYDPADLFRSNHPVALAR